MARNNNRLRRAKLAAQQKQQSKGIAPPGGKSPTSVAADTEASSNRMVNGLSDNRPRKPFSPLRFTLLGMTAFYFVVKTFQRQLLPHGFPVKMDQSRKEFQSTIDFSNDSLQIKHGRTKRIYERLEEGQEPLMVGPETIVFGKDGTLYILSAHGKLVSMTDFQEQDSDGSSIQATATVVKDLGAGRPVSGKFTSDGKTLYISDAILGLTRIRNIHDPKSKVELVASSFFVEDEGRPQQKQQRLLLGLVDDVCIGPKSGKVYFTDASNVIPDRRVGTLTWDLLYPSIVDFLRGKKTGRVLEYDPHKDKVTLLAKDIHFANGIAVDKDESYLVFAETFTPRLWKYHLKGDKKGTMQVAVPGQNLLGYPDGTDCSWPTSSKGGGGQEQQEAKCFAVFPSSIHTLHKFLAKLPDSIDVILRTLLLLLPRQLSPKPIPYGAILEYDPASNQHRYIQDPTGTDISMLTGVTVHKNKLYLGSLDNNYIGVYDLNEPAAKSE